MISASFPLLFHFFSKYADCKKQLVEAGPKFLVYFRERATLPKVAPYRQVCLRACATPPPLAHAAPPPPRHIGMLHRDAQFARIRESWKQRAPPTNPRHSDRRSTDMRRVLTTRSDTPPSSLAECSPICSPCSPAAPPPSPPSRLPRLPRSTALASSTPLPLRRPGLAPTR
jgi:hypothetical protein